MTARRRNTVLTTKGGKARARSVMQSFRLSRAEHAELRLYARQAGLSVSEFVRQLVLVHVRRARAS